MSTNGWGKASINNSNGFGDGAINNHNGWGDSQLKSWSGDTDIDGGLGKPVNTVAPIITGTAQEGQTLTCSQGTWISDPIATYTFQWKRNGSNIISATNSTYTLVTADVGQSIKCTVTATNKIGSTNADSNTVTPTSSVDPDAQAFITAASITDPTQQSAIEQLVTDLKGYGVWTKMKALYPFVGGTAAQHKWNLKDPRDLDAAFRLVFNGGFTHNSNGITGNGTNGFADTKLNENSILTLNNEHISLYVRNNVVNSNTTQMGIFISVSSRFILNYGNSLNYSNLGQSQVGHSLNYPVKGFVALSKTQSTNCVYYQNADLPIIKNGTAGKNNGNFFINALNNGSASQYSDDNIAFASIGDGLSNTDYTNLRTAVQAFQTTLNRQV